MTLKNRVIQLTFHIQNYNERVDLLTTELSRMEAELSRTKEDLEVANYNIARGEE